MTESGTKRLVGAVRGEGGGGCQGDREVEKKDRDRARDTHRQSGEREIWRRRGVEYNACRGKKTTFPRIKANCDHAFSQLSL